MPLRGTNPLKANFTHAFSFPCTAADLCKQNNGGCHKAANCTQLGVKIFCNCQKGYKGDGFTCLPINPCADGFNGGCHEHAICTVIGPVSWMIWVFIGKSETLPPSANKFSQLDHTLYLSEPPVSQNNYYVIPICFRSPFWHPFRWGLRKRVLHR